MGRCSIRGDDIASSWPAALHSMFDANKKCGPGDSDPAQAELPFITSVLFQMLIYRLRHLEHIQFLGSENRLQLFVGDNFPLVGRVL